jgi:hypothetical protein
MVVQGNFLLSVRNELNILILNFFLYALSNRSIQNACPELDAKRLDSQQSMKIKLLEEIFISQRSDLTIMDIGWWQYSILNIKATVFMFTTDEAFVTFFFSHKNWLLMRSTDCVDCRPNAIRTGTLMLLIILCIGFIFF